MFGERWQRILSAKGDDIALRHPVGSLTFRELEARARRLPPQSCPRLGAYYLAQGDAQEVIIALLAGFLHCRPVQVVEKDRTRRVPACRVPRGTALVKQTVGSSGRRRCQFFSLAQIIADVDRLHQALRINECEIAVAALSVTHSFGLTTTLLQTLLHGLPVHWLPTPFPMGLGEALAAHKRIFLPGVPAMWKAWLMAGLDLSQVTLAVSAGSALSLGIENQLQEKMGLKLHNLYGTSECGAISYDFTETPRPDAASIGTLLPGVSAAIGPQGRLLVRSNAVGLGYDETLPGEVFSSGQHLTWDRVEMRHHSLLFQDCLGEGINVASRKLSPYEIAEKIRAATGVRHIRIHGATSRDPERVQDVVACLDLPEGQLTHAFKAAACRGLAPWEVPRQWRSEKPPRENRSHAAEPQPDPLDGFDAANALPAV
jgi:acyl-coenzyme A synthetase/AMP-(fatty) acid ligase